MTDREKLVSILLSTPNPEVVVAGQRNGKAFAIADFIANYLIANGVTFATDNNVGSKWIPVTERLPDEDGSYLVTTTTGMITTARFYISKYFPATKCMPEFTSQAKWQSNRNVTYWMPLPEPPKED